MIQENVTKRANMLWSGVEYYSLENCVVETTVDGVMINSVIVGLYNRIIYRVYYSILLDKYWVTKSCLIDAQLNSQSKKIELEKHGYDWYLNGELFPRFGECIDIDIPLTPLTNSLPINRLQFSIGEEKIVDIIYIDLLEDSLTHVKQRYKRLSSDTFKYENIPNDFEAEITIDDSGFVVDYPQLFNRKIKIYK